MDIYVGNMAFNATEEDLSELLAPLGAVESIKLINDRETGRFRGFAFVTMTNRDEALKAIAELNGKELLGRDLRVREAEEKQKPSGPGGGGFRGGPGGGERRFGGGQGGFRSGDRAPRPSPSPSPSHSSSPSGDRGGFRPERVDRPDRGERPERSGSRNERGDRGDRFERGERQERGGFRGERRSGGGYRREERDDDQY